MQDKLLRMANQIATFMASRPEAEQVSGFADHLNDYWAPAMRAGLLQMIAQGNAGLHPLVLRAASSVRPAPSA